MKTYDQHPNAAETTAIEIPSSVLDKAFDLIELAESRWIGPPPDELILILGAIESAWFNAQDEIVVIPDSVGSSRAEVPRESIEDEQIESELAEIAAWEESPEGQAELELADRRQALRKKRQKELQAQFSSWADQQSELYVRSVAKWRAEARRQIHVETTLTSQGEKSASIEERRMLAIARSGKVRCDLSILRGSGTSNRAIRSALRHAVKDQQRGLTYQLEKWIDIARELADANGTSCEEQKPPLSRVHDRRNETPDSYFAEEDKE